MAGFIFKGYKREPMSKFITFGEIMLRLSPPGALRFGQTRTFDVVYGGGESNVAVSLANYGLQTEFVTRLPANDLGDACLQFLHQYQVGTRHILRGGDRLGIYFLENGSVMRGSKVVYDRTGSSFATLQPGMIDWNNIFNDACWFHWTGITPAISEGAAQTCLEGIKVARGLGVTVSCDLNYRAKLWKWGKKANKVMEELVSYCDMAIGNEEDTDKVFGIRAPETDVTSGKINAESYQLVCDQMASRFPNLYRIAITLRGSISANHNTWSAILWDHARVYKAFNYNITDIVDRVGAGDSFVGGLVYGLVSYPEDSQHALDFAVAASALKHTIFGDFNLITKDEIEKLIEGDGSGRVSR
jgi:2-dehydro-3-deoxygluconokinase